MLTEFKPEFVWQIDGVPALEMMILIREFELLLPLLADQGLIRGATHPSVGMEAIPAGVMPHLLPQDKVTSSHRGHAHCIARGADLGRMLAEIMGRQDGYCGGKGGSMHLGMAELGVLGTNGIVGAGVPLATGAALAAQVQGNGAVAVVFFGDGALNQGVVSESLNLASIWKLPVVFICENNQFAQSAPIGSMVGDSDLTLRGKAYGVPSFNVDGMDVEVVSEAARHAVGIARSGDGPTLLVADTFRYLGHMNGDTEIYRSKEVVEEWRKRDPIDHVVAQLLMRDIIEIGELDAIKERVRSQLKAAEIYANASPFPDAADAYRDVAT